MYMLLALLGSLTVLAALFLWEDDRPSSSPSAAPFGVPEAGYRLPSAWVYILVVTAGLYTHYAYPLILLAVNLAALFRFWRLRWKVGRLESWKGGKLEGWKVGRLEGWKVG
ncbi:MAG: hypothetical protein HC875_03665, partial [Anaerolineales bacterium]|nr:hypothetical protein [Anaerolineales bacterium]